ncbi:acetylserotonin O-methyltransferase [Dehalococcoidia bacterium]|nr:acetylserotonin O-methyltransferase [Dehalococcoidia bacterium]
MDSGIYVCEGCIYINQILNRKSELGKLPPVDITQLSDIVQSVKKFHVLTSARELGIFDCLEIPMSAAELAAKLNFHRRNTGKLCDALVAAGFLIKNEHKYCLSDMSRAFLVKDSFYYQGDLLDLWQKGEERWGKLSAAVKNGPVKPVGIAKQQKKGENAHIVFDKNFTLAMAEGAITWDLPKTMEVLANLPELKQAEKLLDLGGGHGLYALAFKQINPNLKACIFDLPQVIEGTTKHVVASEERITCIVGDFAQDDIGSHYDIVFTSDFLYLCDPEEELKLGLTKIHTSLNSGGLLISKHYHIDDLQKDASAVFFDLMFSMREETDRIYSTAEFCKILEDNGFSLVQVHDISSSSSPSRIIIARKRGALS